MSFRLFESTLISTLPALYVMGNVSGVTSVGKITLLDATPVCRTIGCTPLLNLS